EVHAPTAAPERSDPAVRRRRPPRRPARPARLAVVARGGGAIRCDRRGRDAGRRWRASAVDRAALARRRRDLVDGDALVTARSADDVWAVGEHSNHGISRPLALHWNGERGEAWTAGWRSPSIARTFILHRR